MSKRPHVNHIQFHLREQLLHRIAYVKTGTTILNHLDSVCTVQKEQRHLELALPVFHSASVWLEPILVPLRLYVNMLVLGITQNGMQHSVT